MGHGAGVLLRSFAHLAPSISALKAGNMQLIMASTMSPCNSHQRFTGYTVHRVLITQSIKFGPITVRHRRTLPVDAKRPQITLARLCIATRSFTWVLRCWLEAQAVQAPTFRFAVPQLHAMLQASSVQRSTSTCCCVASKQCLAV